jgi:hypothetical protein
MIGLVESPADTVESIDGRIAAGSRACWPLARPTFDITVRPVRPNYS